MTLDHYTTGRKKFKHLTIAQSGQIEAVNSQSKFHSGIYFGNSRFRIKWIY